MKKLQQQPRQKAVAKIRQNKIIIRFFCFDIFVSGFLFFCYSVYIFHFAHSVECKCGCV